MGSRRISSARIRKARSTRRPLDLEWMEDRQLLSTLTVTNNGDSGAGSLRQAILDANANPGNDLIQFDLPNTALVIQPLTPLPTLSDSGTVLDAESQKGYNKTTGQPLVVLDGSKLPGSGVTNEPGLTVTGGACTIKGLVIENFTNFFSPGILLSGSPGDLVQGCYIGTTPNGQAQAKNAGAGIDISTTSCTIGGIGATARNVISGNSFDGIKVEDTGNRTTIQGNYIGLTASGTAVLGNFDGIQLGKSVGNLIGGSTPGAGNIISGNTFDAIDIGGLGSIGTTADVIQGNYIGTDVTGMVKVSGPVAITNGINISGGGGNTIGGAGAAGNVISGNTEAGVSITGTSAQNNLISGNKIGVASDGTTPLGNSNAGIVINGALNDVIGGTNVTLGNIIAYNGTGGSKTAGVNVMSGTGIEILSNSIHDNAKGGILLGKGANSPNSGASQPAPTITSVQSAAGQTIITGTLNVDAATGGGDPFVIQFFDNPSADSGGLFEGQTLIGQTIVTTDVNGNASFKVTTTLGAAVGDSITATATQQVVQNTSAFSAPVVVNPAPTVDLALKVATNPNPVILGSNETYTVTVTNSSTNDDTNVVYTGVIGTNSTFVSATANPPGGTSFTPSFDQGTNTITADLGTIPAGKSATITIVVSPNSAGSIHLTSNVTGDLLDLNPSDNTDATTVPVSPGADLALALDSAPTPVAVGGSLSYVVTVTNKGPSDVPDATVVETLPGTVTINSVNQTQGNGYQQNGNVLTFDLGTIPANSAVTVTVSVTPNQDGSIIDTATVSSTGTFTSPTPVTDPDLTNNSATNTTVVQKAVNLAVVASATPTPAIAGQPVTFHLSVSNAPLTGTTTSDASSVVVTDILPANIDASRVGVQLSQGTYTIAKGVVTINLGTIPVGGTPPTIAITVVPLTTGSYTNTATVSDAAEINVNTAGTATAKTTVVASPSDVSIAIAANPGTASIGAPLTYVITVTNHGPVDAPGVVAVDQLPAAIRSGAVVTASQGTATLKGSLITANLGTIASGQSATITVVVVPTASVALGDFAGVYSANADPNPSNNLASLATLVSPVDLVVVGAPSTKTPIQGDTLVYGFTVFNAGPSASTATGLNITLPSNVTYVSSMTTQGFTGLSGKVLSAAVGTLAPNAYATVYVTVIPTATGALKASATGFSSNLDTNSANNTATISSTAANYPGSFVLSAPGYAGLETAGSIPVTISRVGGTLGAIDVSYTTAPLTAVPGVNYTTMAGTVQFAAGQTSATVFVPVKHDGAITPNLTFAFGLTGVDNGGSLGSRAAATVTIVNVDRDLVPPQVTAVVPIESGSQVVGYVVDYNKAMDPASAGNRANYTLFVSGRDIGTNSVIIPAAVSYNPANLSVTVIPSAPLSVNTFYGLLIHGASATGVRDASGNLLSGDGSGVAARDYGALIGIGPNLNYVDSAANVVHLAATGAQMEIVRGFGGDAYEVQLLGVNPGHATLSGSVTRSGIGSGSTSIGELAGLGAFGWVQTEGLTTPPFLVSLSSFNAPMPVPQDPISAALIGDLVPNGPAFVAGRIKAKTG